MDGMIRTKVEPGHVRTFLINFINTRSFALPAAVFAKPEVFEAPYARTIARWCLEYVQAHKDAPGPNIQTIYHSWVENDKPPETDELAVKEFLQSLSQEADDTPPPNVPFLLGKFKDYTKKRTALLAMDNARAHFDMGQDELGHEELQKLRTTATASSVGEIFFPLDPAEAARSKEKHEEVLSWQGPAARYMDEYCHREALIGIQAAGKRGKSFLCLEFVYQALRARRRVALFECGDMTREDVEHRLYARIGKVPVRYPNIDGLELGQLRIPKNIRLRKDGEEFVPEVEYVIKKVDHYSIAATSAAVQVFNRRMKISMNNLMVGVYPNKSINVEGCEAELDRIEDETGWTPDVIIFDYLDIMAPEPGSQKDDLRNRLNAGWQAARRLSQKKKACVVCPTQGDADSFTAAKQTTQNFSNDIRKFQHVTAMMAIDQTPDEQAMMVARLHWLLARNGEPAKQSLYITQCLPLGMFICQSALPQFSKV